MEIKTLVKAILTLTPPKPQRAPLHGPHLPDLSLNLPSCGIVDRRHQYRERLVAAIAALELDVDQLVQRMAKGRAALWGLREQWVRRSEALIAGHNRRAALLGRRTTGARMVC